MDTVKINQLEIENVKRIKAIALTPNENGLTVIGGDNNQGKTSVLDSIAWALGGDRLKPSEPNREGSVLPPRIKVTLSNGLIVERSGKNGSLKVTDPNGNKSGQQLLNSFIEELALNLPKFMSCSNREKADVLLQIIGIKEDLMQMEQRERELYNKRRMIGKIAEQKKAFAKEMPFYPDAPEEPISPMELIQRQQKILLVNAENNRKRQIIETLRVKKAHLEANKKALEKELSSLNEQIYEVDFDLQGAEKTAQQLVDESTSQIESDLANIEQINIKVRSNMDRMKADQEADDYCEQYESLSNELEEARKARYNLLKSVRLPLDGLMVEDGELTFNGQKWDNMSGSDQLRVSTAIVRALNPSCGFVLLDKLEQMDIKTLNAFGHWLREQGLQAIATRVSTGDECSIIIDDGMAVTAIPEIKQTWKAGEF